MNEYTLKAFRRDPNDERFRVNAHEIKPGIIYKDENVTVKAFLVKHGDVEAFGYRFETPDRTIVISGDMGPTQSIVDNCKGYDVLIHEAYSMASHNEATPENQARRKNLHTSSQELAEIARKAKPGFVLSLPPRGGNEYVPITQSQPIAQIGGSIFVYRGRFEIPLAAALSHAERANQFVRLKRFEEAVADGRKAVKLGPDDSRTHISLGIALAQAGQKDEARREFGMVIETAKLNPSLFRNAEVRAQQELKRLD